MSKKKNQQIDVEKALSNGKMKVRPMFVEFKVVADLSTEDGTFIENVAAQDRITAVNFNGASVQEVIDKAMVALEEKYCEG